MKLAYDHYQLPEGTENKNLAPIIFIHGGNDSRKTWSQFAQKIVNETGREAYAYDMRNHGDSPWSDEMQVDVLVDDLEEFMGDRNIHRAILIGHSLGGKTIIAFALKKPEAVEMLIIEDTGLKKYDTIIKKALLENVNILKECIKSVPLNATEEEAKNSIVDFLTEKLLPAQPGGIRRAIYDIHTVPIRKEGNAYVLQTNVDAVTDLIWLDKSNKAWTGVYPGDVLFIYGTKSFVKVQEDKDIYKFFPQATKLPVEGVGHLIHQVCPEKFAKIIIDFILQSEKSYF